MNSQVLTPSRPMRRWVMPAIGVAVAIATFDPHFETFEFVTYVLRTFLPELTLVGLAFAIVGARRAGLFALVVKHRASTAVLAVSFALLTQGFITRSVATRPGFSGADLSMFVAAPGSHLWQWLKSRTDAYSSKQVDYFREDMKLHAVDAFLAHDFSATEDYVRAWGGVFPLRVADLSSTAAMQFLVSRERYIQNHKARIANLGAQFPLAPARLYMMRAVSQLQRDDQFDPELVELRGRVHAAGVGARTAMENCLISGTMPQTSADARGMINLTIEAMGAAAPWRDNTAGDEWCAGLLKAHPDQQVRQSFLDRFETLIRNLWGSALRDPRQEKTSGPPPLETRPTFESQTMDLDDIQSFDEVAAQNADNGPRRKVTDELARFPKAASSAPALLVSPARLWPG